ncbi:hypothetical protein K3495_g8693 [Podosphaera aphanis]|nr:hypothetical protein K3495_g8693 [Podosphaera aphanis]
MYFNALVIVSLAQLVIGSPSVFSVHDDLLAFPQYQVIFSERSISESETSLFLSQASSPKTSVASAVISFPASQDDNSHSSSSAISETYEFLYLQNKKYLCNIPLIEPPIRNETSEREARVAERQELARATDRGWELLRELEGNCLYFVSGWWSYSFCHNDEVIQFHQLSQQPGKQEPVKQDPSSKQFVLGKAANKEDHWNQLQTKPKGQVDVPKNTQAPKSELQVKGGSRYLVQRMEGGTICDLTGKPRKIEIQFHCNPTVTDRIGYIKEVTTCSYLMVIYTPRLCNDIAFLPPTENKVHTINCRSVVAEKDNKNHLEVQIPQVGPETTNSQVIKKKGAPKVVGGILLGGGKWINIENQQMPIPEIFGEEVFQHQDQVVEIIARAKGKAQGGQVEVVTPADLKKLDLDPDLIDALRVEVQNLAKEKGWKIKIVDAPGQTREILGIIDEDEDDNVVNEDKDEDVTNEMEKIEKKGEQEAEDEKTFIEDEL